MEDGSEKPITLISQTLSIAETKYSQLEKEALAIVFAVKKLPQYLYGRSFTIYSDHQPLKYLLNEARQIPVMASSRIQHWAGAINIPSYTDQELRWQMLMPSADSLYVLHQRQYHTRRSGSIDECLIRINNQCSAY